MNSDNSYRAIVRRMPLMDEKALRAALVEELEGERRMMVLERLHQRYCKVRAERERLAIFNPNGELPHDF
jgi:hypothetical protein